MESGIAVVGWGLKPVGKGSRRRHGTKTLITAPPVATGNVVCHVRKSRIAAELVDFMEAGAKRYPKKKIVAVWANLRSTLTERRRAGLRSMGALRGRLLGGARRWKGFASCVP